MLHCCKVHCAVLYCTLLYSTLLYSTLLYSTLLYYSTPLYSTIICCPIKRLPNFVLIYSGMRLALPDSIDGIPVRHIQAYDCSENANIVRWRTDTDFSVFDSFSYFTYDSSFLAGTTVFLLFFVYPIQLNIDEYHTHSNS